MVNWRMCKNICAKARLNSKNHKHVSHEMRSRITRSQCLQAVQRQGGGRQMPRWWGSISSDWQWQCMTGDVQETDDDMTWPPLNGLTVWKMGITASTRLILKGRAGIVYDHFYRSFSHFFFFFSQTCFGEWESQAKDPQQHLGLHC